MDFYTRQDAARRNSRWLVLLFVLAVCALIAITNVLVALLLFFSGLSGLSVSQSGSWAGVISAFSFETFGWISIGVISTVFLVIVFKWAQLSAGGKSVAENLGGTRILPSSSDPAERRCLNVVNEMALAASLPVPPVYVLNDEQGINAFAAGISPADAVIGVTRGSLERFDRDQLQGVMAHEFSHILNGDMRLNIRLAAFLKGITFIGDLGEVVFRGSRHGRSAGYGNSRKVPSQILLVGLVLWVTGWLGGLFAGFIKAAVSRQREYLADASAVQFTRNPLGVAAALKVIGGYVPGTVVVAGRAQELSHIFFGQIAQSLTQVFATHPPLEERIRRIDPAWDGQYPRVTREQRYQGTADDKTRRQDDRVRAAEAATVIASAVLGVGAADAMAAVQADADFIEQVQIEDGIPAAVIAAVEEPLGAEAVVYSLLLAAEPDARQQQVQILLASNVSGLAQAAQRLHAQLVTMAPQYRLPLLELSLPALKCMSAPQYRQFRSTLLEVVRADKRITLYEWCLYQLIRHFLDPEFVRVRAARPKHKKTAQVADSFAVVASVLAWHGHGEEQAAGVAFARACSEVGLNNATLKPVSDCGVQAFSAAVAELGLCYPLLKPALLKGLAAGAATDGQLTPVEHQLLAAVAAVIDCPLPPLGPVA